MKQKINLRLFLIALLAVIATTIGVTIVYYNLFQTRVRKDLNTIANLLSGTGMFRTLYSEVAEEQTAINQKTLMKLHSDNIRITWISSDGTVLYDNDMDYTGLSNHLDRPEIKCAIESGSGESVRRSDTMNMSTFYYAIKLEDNTILRVSTKARTIGYVFFVAAPVIGIIILAVMAVCVLFGHFLTQKLIEPINSMAEHLNDNPEVMVYRELEPFAEKIRSQHEKILEAATMRQDFSANISHELKTPLTAISGYAELIENNMVDKEKEIHIAKQIRNNASRLLSLINDIIKLSELDHKDIPRKFERVDLYEIAENCCKELSINAKGMNVSLTNEGSKGTFVLGERELLKELVENLVQNAIRYNIDGGYVKVTTLTIEGHAVLSVSDNGIGIPGKDQEHVFERFYRVDKSRSRETGGTGLGLAIVKHIAEIHNAEINLLSYTDKGTVITIKF